MPDRYYRDLFHHLNGLVFPGGAVKLDNSGYGRAARQLWDTAAKHSDVRTPPLDTGIYRRCITHGCKSHTAAYQ